MAATVSVKQATGSGPTNTTITNLRFKTADDPSGTDTTYPLRKPASGLNYSYVASVYLNADTAPAGTINNVKFYTDGAGYSGLGTSLTTNGTFTSNIDSWSQANNYLSPTLSWSSGRLLIDGDTNGTSYIGAKQNTSSDWGAVTAGQYYRGVATAEEYLKPGGNYASSTLLYVIIKWFDSSDAQLSFVSGSTVTSTGTPSVIGLAPPGAVKAFVEVRQRSDGGVTKGMGSYWDDVALQPYTKTLKGITTSSYSQATGTQGTTGDLSSSVYTNGTNVFTYTSAAPLSISGSVSASTGKITDYLQMQMSVDSAVTTETLTAETFTFRYDET